MKRGLHGEQFTTNVQVISRFHVILNGQALDKFLKTILIKRAEWMERCLASQGRYFECLTSQGQYFEKEQVTKEDTESEDKESITDDE